MSYKLYNCCLGSKYLSAYADIVRDPSFEFDEVMIQNNRIDEMTVAERVACTILLADKPDEYQANKVPVSIAEKLFSKKRICQRERDAAAIAIL